MPELPEVESVRRTLEKPLRGRRIVSVTALPDPVVFGGVSHRRFPRALQGRRITALKRRGKYLWFELDERPWPLFHFGMTGWFRLDQGGDPLPRFAKLALTLEGGRRAVFTDVRRFGRVRLLQDPASEPPVSRLGHDPLEALPPVPELVRQLARRSAPLKAVLLDQSVFAGVGNWIADEVLYQAALRPQRPASSLSAAEVRTLRAKLLQVVERAVAVDADSGRFPRQWLFHYRWGKKAGMCTARGEPIAYDTVGGRTTAWAPARQK